MARIWSRPFLSLQGVTGGDHVVTVPAGHVYIVRAFTIYAHTLLDAPKIVLKDFISQAVLIYDSFNPGQRRSAYFDVHLPFLEGEQFGISVDPGGPVGDGIDVYVGGYSLFGPTTP